MPAKPAPGDKSPEGLLLIGHGTADPIGVEEFQRTAQIVAGLVESMPVQACFLELARPLIDEGVAALVTRGVRRITAAPLVLFAAGHARRDVPAALQAAVAGQRGITWTIAGHLGEHPGIVRLSNQRFQKALRREKLSGLPDVAPDDTLLLLVGRGSREGEANDQMRSFAALRRASLNLGGVDVCYLSMASPLLDEALPQIAARGYQRIVVQPHLLFRGKLLERLAKLVSRAQSEHPQIQWIVTEHLGASELLASVVVDNAARTS